ncbi:phosphate ABC transporter substrate-binding protein PstS [Agilicoccus flavus]|uniref:phosphate ABC transporter substrate-binding protein PstS n=1 Tax=Agilicoccus flavus TaxID=2775968 RepID=UPI001CF6344D|nr:phosphate ABC transporter substrate-binding protein PstS [Agilicoccus flavus]
MLGSPDNGVPVLRTEEARRRRVLMPLFVLVVLAVVVLLLTAAGRRTEVVGSGSTLAQPLIERSAVDYRNSRSADDPQRPGATGGDWIMDGSGSGVDYEAVGSLGGIMRLSDPDVDFAVADYPLTRAALAGQRVVQFPLAIGAVAVVHGLDLGGRPLRLDATTVADVYLGRITRWDDPALAALNPGTPLPPRPITAVHRTDGSGSTLAVTRYLAEGSPAWAKSPGAGTEVAWPTGRGVERSAGVVAAVRDDPGAIGYVEHGQATRAGVQVARLENGRGEFVAPDEGSIGAAVAGTDFSGKDDYAAGLAAPTTTGAYPLAAAVFALVEPGRRETRAVLRYLDFVIDSSDAAARDLGYVPLSEDAAEAVRSYRASALHGNG